MNEQVPKTTRDLRGSERRFLEAMQLLGHGRFESVQILKGELVLKPWPATIRSVKFGNAKVSRIIPPTDFELKTSVIELLEHVRSIEAGVIRALEVRGGLPFCMEIDEDKNPAGS
jgi:hypothetical protein